MIQKVKDHPRVKDLWTESKDTSDYKYWITLARGYSIDGVHGASANTLKQILSDIKSAEPCRCNNCKGDIV